MEHFCFVCGCTALEIFLLRLVEEKSLNDAPESCRKFRVCAGVMEAEIETQQDDQLISLVFLSFLWENLLSSGESSVLNCR